MGRGEGERDGEGGRGGGRERGRERVDSTLMNTYFQWGRDAVTATRCSRCKIIKFYTIPIPLYSTCTLPHPLT